MNTGILIDLDLFNLSVIIGAIDFNNIRSPLIKSIYHIHSKNMSNVHISKATLF